MPVQSSPEFDDAPPPSAADDGQTTAPPVSAVPQRRAPRAVQVTVGAITLVAIAAILLGIFLPREKPTARQQQGPRASAPATLQNPAPAGNAQDSWQAPPQQTPGTGVAQSPQAQTPQGTAAVPATGYNAPQQTSASGTTGAQGNRYVSCPDCGGRGEVACPMKHLPNGHMLNPLFWNESRYYSGNDPLLPDDADMGECPICHGTLKTKCPRCEGNGQIVEGSPPPTNPFPQLSGMNLQGVDPETLKALTGGAGAAAGE